MVPISKNLAQWLRKHRKKSGPVWPQAQSYMTRCYLVCAAAADVKWKHNALRHSYISYRVAAAKIVALPEQAAA